MFLLRRSIAALCALFLLQLTLLGNGTSCDTPHRDAGTMHQTADKPVKSSTPMHCDAAESGDDCRLPFAAGHCAAMTACALNALPPRATGESPTGAAALEGRPATLAFSGPTYAPDLPPPRV